MDHFLSWKYLTHKVRLCVDTGAWLYSLDHGRTVHGYDLDLVLELHVSVSWVGLLTLHKDENGGTGNCTREEVRSVWSINADRGAHWLTGNEVEGQVHDVADEGLGAEFLERTLQDLAKSFHGIATGLELPALAHHASLIARDKRTVKRVKQSILKQEVSRDKIDDDRTLIQYQESSREGSQGAVHKEKNGELGQVGEEEHATDDHS